MKDLDRGKERYDFSIDARQLGLVLMAVAVIVALVFTLGVSVGVQWERKKSGEPMRAAMAASRSAPKAAAGATAHPVPAAPPVLAPVTTTTGARTDKAGGRRVTAAAGARPEKQEPPVSLTFPKVLTSNTRNTAPLKQDEKKNEVRARKYTVQVGAYNEKDAAKARVDKLRKKGYDARVYNAGGKKYAYKVRVGSFGTRAEAVQAARKMQSAEKVSPFITTGEM